MRRATYIALVAVVLAWARVALADSTCTYREEEVAAPAASVDSLTLLAVDPPEGGELRRESIVAIDLQYQVADFQPQTYLIAVLFPVTGNGFMSPRNVGQSPLLRSASAKVRLCVPLEKVYAHPGMLWPLSLSATMLKMGEGGRSAMSAFSRTVKFQSPDAPASQKALPPEYYQALQLSNDYFDNRLMLYKPCSARFPEMQTDLTTAYRAWEARHRADIDLVTELQFKQYLQMANGHAGHASNLADSMTAMSRSVYEGLEPKLLKYQCDTKLAEFRDPLDKTNMEIGEAIATLRKHAAGPAKKGE